MKTNLKIVSLALAAAVASFSFAGCSKTGGDSNSGKTAGEQPVATSTAPTKISIFRNWDREFREDLANVQELSKKFNVKFDVQMIKDANQYKEKLNLMLATGDLPDIVSIGGLDIKNYASSGYFIEMDKLVDKYGENLKKVVPKEAWEMTKSDGKLYGIPSVNNNGKYVTAMRADWLKNVNKQVPETLDQFYDVLKAFTFDDPDKNGKNDTFGLGSWAGNSYEGMMPIFGAFGIMPEQYTLVDGKVKSPFISKEYKEALTYIKKLVDEKLVDPESFTQKSDQGREKYLQSKVGTVNAWWNATNQTLMDQYKMKSINPAAEWVKVRPPKGSSGKWGVKASDLVQGTVSITTKCKAPETVMKIFDYLMSDEGYALVSYGIKDKDYKDIPSIKWGVEFTADGQKLKDAKQIDTLQLMIRRDILLEGAKADKNPEIYAAQKFALENNLYDNIFVGITTDESKQYLADLQKFEQEQYIKFIFGQRSLSEFDKYVAEWKDKGGEKIRQSYLKIYNKNTGKNLVFAE